MGKTRQNHSKVRFRGHSSFHILRAIRFISYMPVNSHLARQSIHTMHPKYFTSCKPDNSHPAHRWFFFSHPTRFIACMPHLVRQSIHILHPNYFKSCTSDNSNPARWLCHFTSCARVISFHVPRAKYSRSNSDVGASQFNSVLEVSGHSHAELKIVRFKVQFSANGFTSLDKRDEIGVWAWVWTENWYLDFIFF